MGKSQGGLNMANGDWGHSPTLREQNLEQEVERLRSEVARLRAELDKVKYKRRYNPTGVGFNQEL